MYVKQLRLVSEHLKPLFIDTNVHWDVSESLGTWTSLCDTDGLRLVPTRAVSVMSRNTPICCWGGAHPCANQPLHVPRMSSRGAALPTYGERSRSSPFGACLLSHLSRVQLLGDPMDHSRPGSSAQTCKYNPSFTASELEKSATHNSYL